MSLVLQTLLGSLPLVGLRVVAFNVKDRRDAVKAADRKHHVIDYLPINGKSRHCHDSALI